MVVPPDAAATRIAAPPADARTLAARPSGRTSSPGRDALVPRAVGETGTRFGRFLLLAELGRGGMGAVYRAKDEGLGRTVALKVVLEAGDSGARARFAREVEAVARLRHPSIVAVHGAGETDGKPWLVMDLVPGRTLKRRLAAEPGEPRLPLAKALEAVRDVARAVQHAHENGVLHRDLKPENVIVDDEGRAHVLDFGLAKLHGRSRLTRTGATLGTPAYMPPEQVRGDEADARSDVYALGATLYFVLAGRPPFEGATEVNVLAAVLKKPPVPPRSRDASVPLDLETICLRCLEKDPRRRYATAAEVADELDRFLGGEPILARPPGRLERLRRRVISVLSPAAGRSRAFTALLALLALSFAVAVAAGAAALRRAYRDSAVRSEVGFVDRCVVEAEQEASGYHERALAALGRSPPAPDEALEAALSGRRSLEEALGKLGCGLVSPEAAAVASARRSRLASSPLRTGLEVVAARALLLAGDPEQARLTLVAAAPPGAGDAERSLALAESCLLLDDSRAALDAFEAAARAAPDRWEPLAGRVVARARSGLAPAGDDADLGRARSNGAPAAALDEARAELLLAAGKTDESLALLARAIRASPAALGPRLLRARVLRAAGDESGALADLRAAGETSPLATRRELELHLRTGALPDAVAALGRLLRLLPRDVGVAIELARTHAAMGDAATGLDLLEKTRESLAARRAESGALRLLEEEVPFLVALGRDPRKVLDRLAASCPLSTVVLLDRAARAGSPSEACRILEEGVARAPDPATRARLSAELAARALARGDLATARARADEALAVSPSARAHHVRGALLAAEGDRSGAARERDLAVASQGRAYRLAYAEGRADALVSLESEGGLGRRRREEARRGRGREPPPRFVPQKALVDRARAELAFAAAVDPEAAAPRALLARLAEQQGLRAEAERHARDALAADPLDPDAAAVLARTGTATAETIAATARAAAFAGERAEEEAAAPTTAVAHPSRSSIRAGGPGPCALLRAERVRLFAKAGESARAVRHAGELADEWPRDRDLAVLRTEILEKARDPGAARARALLDALDADYDAGRAAAVSASEKGPASRSDRLALCARSLEQAPDDDENLAALSKALRDLSRDAPTSGVGALERLPAAAAVVVARRAIVDGRATAETLWHFHGERQFITRVRVDSWHESLGRPESDDRPELVLVNALSVAWRCIYEEALGDEQRGTIAVELHDAVRPSRFADDVARVTDELPEVALGYAARAAYHGRTRRSASMGRDLERLTRRWTDSASDYWVAAAARVSAGDVEGAEPLALHGIEVRDPSDTTECRHFVEFAPFRALADSRRWQHVSQAVGKRTR